MLVLAKSQIKFLKKLSKVNSIKCDTLTSDEMHIVRYLDENGLINADRSIRQYPNFNTGELKFGKGKYLSVSISEKGKSFFAERRSNTLRFSIPVIISVFALLTSGISLIMQFLIK